MTGMEKLMWMMNELRNPKSGCPWDQQQTHETLKQYFLEEAHEFVECLDQNGPLSPKTIEELGDVLFQIAFHCQLLNEKNIINLDGLAQKVTEKYIARHPHVFDSSFPKFKTPEDVQNNWELLKAAAKKGQTKDQSSDESSKLPMSQSLKSIPRSIGALQKASRLGDKAANFRFDWPDAPTTWKKVREELLEFEEAILETQSNSDDSHQREELGDLMFAIAQYSRKRGWDPESLLGAANNKFMSRFEAMENKALKEGLNWKQLNLEGLEALWQSVKKPLKP